MTCAPQTTERIEAGVRMLRKIVAFPDAYLRSLLSRPEDETYGSGLVGMTVGQILDLAEE
jgi:hypothetical protein